MITDEEIIIYSVQYSFRQVEAHPKKQEEEQRRLVNIFFLFWESEKENN